MSTTRKFLRGMGKVTLSNIGKATKLQKVVSAVTAMGFVLQPMAALASEITRLDNGKEVKFNNGVADVWAGTIVDDVAMNVFKKFDVNANDIANMYFKKDANSTDVNNLVNLVFARINVNGTVNAIQNSKIGGNLFFLSSDGLAVNGSGVINAGSLTVMTPTPDHLVQAGLASWVDKESGTVSSLFGGGKDVDALQKAYLIANWKAIESMNIPINKMGNITVKGRINTTNGIKFKAAHIDISKDENRSTNPKDISPVLQSGMLDFSSMVNTTDAQGKIVNANIQNLTAATAMDGSGDIVLSAVAESVNVKDDNFAVLGTGVTGYNAVKAEVTVGEGARIIANKQGEKQGDVKITAEASVGKGQGSLFDIKSKLDEISADDLIGTMAKTVANVDVDGKVEGNKIDIQANAENKYVNGSISNMNNFAGSLIKSYIPLDSDVNYVVMENKAEVNIGEKAQLVAHAKDKLDVEKKDDEITVNGVTLNITANANMKASAGSAAAASKLGMKKLLKNNGSDLGQVVPNAGVTYLETDNQANVNIKGSVKSAGGSNIAAKAEIEAEAAAAADAPSPVGKLDSNNFVNAAVTIADIKNSAQVDIANSVTAEDGLRVDARSKGSYTTAAEVNAGETSMANTAINITDVNSNAKVNINGSLQAKNIDITAQNDVENEFTANNSTGMSKFAAKMATKKLTAVGGLMGQAKKKSLKAPQGLSKLGEMFTVGASVGVINETNKADVTLGKNAVINATGTSNDEGKLNIAANTNLAGSYINVSGKSSNYKDKTDQQVMVNASVLVSNMDSSANVVVEAGEKAGGKHAVLQGKDITVNAGSEFTYARPQKMVADLKDLLEDIKSAYEADKAVLEAVEKLLQLNAADEENYFKNPSEAGAMEFFGNLQELADLINSSAVDANMDGMKAVTSLPSAILAFVDGSKYTNFYVASSTAGRDGSTGGNAAQLAVAGAVNVNQLANNAQVIIGRNAVIKADGGDVALNAKAVQQDVTLNGKMKYVIPGVTSAGGGVVAVGGNVGVHHSDVNSVVAVAGGADISGENINIGAENEVLHIAATYGGGKGGSIGVSGMAAYMEGTSDSIAAVDDKAKLETQNKLAVTAKNDTNIQNIIAEFAKAGGSAAGASVGYVDYKVNNIAAVANIDKSAKRAANDEVSDLNTLLNGKLKRETLQLGVDDDNKGEEVKYADLTEQLGVDAAGEAGSITAKNVSVDAKTTGVIDNITVAGSITGGKSNMTGKQLKLPVNITGAGSASVNTIIGNTAALLEDTAVTITATADEKAKGQGAVNVAASDDSMIGAYSGAAALKKQSLTAGKGAGVALAGAVAYNKMESDVIAQLKNVQIKDAKSISNEARKEGAQVAVGLAAEVNTSLSSGSTSVNGAANASANEITNKVHAVMNNVSTSTTGGYKTDIANVAQDKDIQVAGGITAQYAKNGGLGVGVAASYQDITNDIQSKIIGGKLENVGELQAYAASELVQVGTAVSVGVQQGQSANGVQGSVAINNLTNNVGVTIEDAKINADSVDAKAFDGKVKANEKDNTYLAGLAADGFDVKGTDAMADVNVDGNGGDVNVDADQLGKTETTQDRDGNDVTKAKDGKSTSGFTASDNKGNLVITGATSVNVNASSGGTITAGASVATNNIANSFNTKISGADITTSGAKGVSAKAESDTLMVGVTAGVAAAKSQSGGVAAGSAGVMQLKNNTTATIENSTLTTGKVDVDAATKSRLINVAGQVSAGKGYASIGLAGATNVLNNTTGAYIKGAAINAADTTKGVAISANADNQSKAYAIVGAVTVATNQSSVAANGTVAVNKGTNNTEAIVDAVTVTENSQQQQKENTFNNIKSINVNAQDATIMKAIAGGVVVGKGYASVGGAVAYNEIGDFTSGNKQNTVARLNKAAITTVKDSTIDVKAEDKSNLLTIAAGVSVTASQQGAAAQGSAATTLVNKNTEASMTGTSVSKANDDGADVNVNAKTESKIITSADAISATTANAAGGAGVAVNRTEMDTKAFIDGGTAKKTITAKSVGVKAESKADIINVGIGAALTTGQGGSAAGNVSVNNIANNTEAGISNATITTKGNTAVLAKSEEQIKNYAGALAATVGQGYVAGGASVAVNKITGNTKASVDNAAINAGNGTDISFAGKTSKGLVVAADSDHEIDNVVITAGIAATSEVGVAASGTVAVNTIKGATTAEITNSDTNVNGTAGDVNVIADDSTDINSAVGALAVGVGGATAGVAAGASSDTNVLGREVTAQVVGNSTNKNTVNADKLNVNAKSANKVITTAVGAAAAGGLYGAAGVAGTVSVTKTDATTLANVSNINSNNNGFAINANRTNNITLTGASAAATVAIGAGSLGMTIGVMSDSSTTQAQLDNANITHNNTTEAEDAIHAESTTNVTTALVSEAVSASIGGSIGGVVGVNNLDNKVLTTVNNSKSAAEGKNAAKKVAIDAHNRLTTSYNTSAISAALGAGAIGVGVNTIDTSVVTQVSGSKLKAQNVDVKAEEERALKQTAVNAAVGGMGLSGNVLVNNIGTAIAETGTYNGADYDISGVLSNVDKSIGEQNSRSENISQNATKDIIGNGTDITDGFDDQLKGTGEYANNNSVICNANVSSNAGVENGALNNGLTAVDRSGSTTAQGVQVIIDNSSEITATNKADIKANTETNTNITAGVTTVGATAASGTFSILNVKRNSGVTVENSKIAAKEMAITSKQAGKANMNIYQGVGGMTGINVAVGIADLTGENRVTLNNAALVGGIDETDGKNHKNSISVRAEDNSAVAVNVYGGTVGMTALGVLWSDASNESTNTISVADSTLRAAEDVYETEVDENKNKIQTLVGYTDLNNIDIATVKANTISAKTIGGAVGANSAQGVVARASDSGSSKVTVTGKNFFIGNVVNITAQNNPVVKAEAQAYSGALLASAGATIAKAKADGEVEVNIDEGSEFTAKTINAEASVGTQNGKANVEAKTIGGSVAGYASIGFNEASAENSMTVKNNIEKNTYIGVEDLNIIANNASVIKADVTGVTIGGALAVANNLAKTTTNLITTVNAKGAVDKKMKDANGDKVIISSLGNVNIKGAGYGDVTNSANGNGGGLVAVSPIAAKAENNLTTNTDVSISGTWNNIASMTAAATNSDNLDINADSVTAAVVGASGTHIDNTVSHTASVNVTGTVTSDGKQSYNASNAVNHDVDLKGNGYGVGAGAATAMTNKLTYTAKVNMNNATLKGVGDSGAIEALASTSGKMDYDNILKSAGLVAGTFAQSDNTLTYDNAINLTKADLSTAKMDQDITLAATDETKANFETMADTQGGAVGASGATTKNTLTRNNKIDVDADSKLLSTNDVNIYAGANVDGISSSLDYNVVADAYNKTVVPVGTKPKVDNTMYQNNQVAIAGNINSVRHVNLKAIKGLTTVAESAREYNIYKGNSGSGSLTSTAFGEQNSNETAANKIAVTGEVNAGIHNNLELKITGSTTVKQPDAGDTTGETGEIKFDGIEAAAGTGQDWFDVDQNVDIGVGTITNSLMDRYLELNELLVQYNPSSDEYQSLRDEQKRIVAQMKANGFTREIDDGEGGTRTEVSSEINIPVLDINDIVISGGNINIDTDELTGQDKLNAQAAGNLSVTNESDLYLKINDLVIKDKGGQVYLNGSSVKGSAGTSSTTEPTITVKSTGSRNDALDAAPDIGIFGKVINSTGDVYIENTKYDIAVGGNANISARNITLKADNGSVTQNSEGLLLIGGDPVTKWQFSDSIAKKIQTYLSKNVTSKTINSFNDYKNWLLSEGGFGFNETEKNEIRSYKYDDSKGIVAGNNVYISGLNVNIDGLVQSGYKNYKVDLSNDQVAKNKLTELENEFNANKTALTNREVMANEHYCITTNAGAKYNSETGVYDYNVRVYYNPYTKELLTESIEPNGGNIYITGAISSTGSGKLRAMDGTPDISINTSNIDKDLRVNSITNKNIEGLISIRDTATNTLTEYKNKDGRVDVSTISIAKKGENTDAANRATSTEYKPKAGTTLSWTGGTSGDKDIIGYEYTKNFVGWGLIKYKTSKEFIDNTEVINGRVATSSTSITGDDPLGKGIIIGVNSGKPEYSVSTKKWNTSETVASEIVSKKKYSGWKGKIFGYGKVHYTWTETTGTSTSSTYTIKADKAIDVGFMTGGNGNINITSQKDMLLNGNISNAANSGSAIGNVTLTSNSGSISSVGNARVNADNLTINAATGVDINHGALGSDATIDVKSTKGDVTINSDKGNLNFIGGAEVGAKSGNLNITAAGNLKTADGTILNGTRIDFVSGGAINANIAPGQNPTSSDTMSASVNAKAQGDITLTNNNGDMRLGVIESADGNVVLTTSGSFIDAVGDATFSDSENKLAKWKEMGLISDVADAGDRAQAAAASKKERLNALETQAKHLALKAGKTTEEAQNTLFTEYKTVADNYAANGESAFNGKDYSDEVKTWIKTYADLNKSDAYGWSQNDLLYAVQAGVLSTKAGEILMADKANVAGKNITLNAGKNIGIDGEAKNINYADLSQEENIKLLAQAKGGDLTWKDAALEIRQQRQITVQLKDGGQLNLNANTSKTEGEGNIYLAGVKGTLLDISGTINTTKDVKLLSDKGVSMKDGNIAADNLIIYGGDGDVGSAENNIKTNISGNLEANSKNNVYIHQIATEAGKAANVLTIQNIAAKNVYLSADNGMKMTTEQGKISGGITAELIKLTAAGGDIGVASDGIRITENGVVVNAVAKNGSIYLQGIGDAGSLELKNVDAKESVDINASGDINIGNATEAGSVKAGASVAMAGKEINLNAGKLTAGTSGCLVATNNVTLASGVLTAGADSKITASNDIAFGTSKVTVSGENTSLKLDAGATVIQNENAAGIEVANLTVESGKTQQLLSKNNKVKSLVIKGKGQNALTVDGLTKFVGTVDELDVTVADSNIKGDVIIENYQEDIGKVNIKTTINTSKYDETHKGSITVKADSDITTADNVELNAADKLEITSKKGSITAGGNLTAGTDIDVTTDKGNIEAKSDIKAFDGNINIKTSEGNITTAAVNAAAGYVSLTTKEGNITANNEITSKNASVVLNTDNGAIEAKANVTAKNNITATATGDITAAGNIEAATGKAAINSSGASVSTKNVKAGTNVDIDAGASVSTNDVTAGTDVDINAGASVTTDNVTAGNNTNLTAGASITTEGIVKATTGNVSYDAKTGITANGSVTAGTDVSMKTTTGSITANGSVTATKGNASFNVDKNGNVTTGGDVKADKDITYDAKGSITTGGSINSTLGNINLSTKADAGNMTFGGNIKADNGNIGITAKENGSLQFNGNVITDNGNIDIIVEGNGNILDNDKLFSATGEKGDKAIGSIKLQIKGAGDIDLNEIFATNDASVDVANGNLTLAKIDGNLVAIQLRTEGKTMNVKDIIAGSKVVAKGSNMDLDKIKQRLDVGGMLTIVPDGAQNDAPIDNLRIGEIATNTGVRFEHLWLNNGSINVSEGRFHIDKMVVNDNAHFSNAHMTTAVWGNPPQRDQSDSVYWNNTAVNNPKDNLSEWQAEDGINAEKWMYLHFTEIPNIQLSNGVLLDLRNYDYVYNQRFTAADQLNYLLAENKADEYDINFKPEVVRYFRYDLYDLEHELAENAAPEEVIVEA